MSKSMRLAVLVGLSVAPALAFAHDVQRESNAPCGSSCLPATQGQQVDVIRLAETKKPPPKTEYHKDGAGGVSGGSPPGGGGSGGGGGGGGGGGSGGQGDQNPGHGSGVRR